MPRKKNAPKLPTAETLAFLAKVGKEHDRLTRPALLTASKEALVLQKDEDVTAFMGRLQEAIEATVQWGPEVRHWCVTTVGDGWAILHVVEVDDQGAYEEEFFRLAFQQNDAGDFAISGPLVEVRQTTNWVPVPAEPGEGNDGKKPEPMSAEQSRAAFKLVREGGQKATKRELLKLEEYTFEDATGRTSPSGEPYLGVLKGYGAVDSVINENLRLYDPDGVEGEDGMIANAARIKGEITRAFASGTGSLPGELDHPSDSETWKGVATELIECRREGVRLYIEQGIMNTPAGQALKVVASHKMPIGVSTLSYTLAESRIMDEANPYFLLNKDRKGQVYDHMIRFQIVQFDNVRVPSAGVYVQEAGRFPKEALEAYALLCEDGSAPEGGKCKDGCVAKPRISETERRKNQEKIDMNPKLLKEMLQNATKEERAGIAEALAQVVPELAALTALPAKLDASEKRVEAAEKTALAQGEKVTALEKLVADQGAIAKTQGEAIEGFKVQVKESLDKVATLTGERDKATWKADFETAVNAEKSKTFFGLRDLHIRDWVYDETKPAKEQVEARSKTFDETRVPLLTPELVNQRPVTEAHHGKAYNKADAFAGDPLPFSVSDAPAPKADPKSNEGARQ